MAARVIDGIDGLKEWVGREAGVGDWLTIPHELIQRFAALSGDNQWIHVDAERARRESPFGAPVAHGFLTVALLSRLVKDAVEVRMDRRMGVNYGFNRLRFPAPVPAGARIRARVTPNSVSEFSGGAEIAWGVVVEVEGQAKPALAAEWLVRLYF